MVDDEWRNKRRAKLTYRRRDVGAVRVRREAEDPSRSCRCWKVDAPTETRSEDGAGDATNERIVQPEVCGTR